MEASEAGLEPGVIVVQGDEDQVLYQDANEFLQQEQQQFVLNTEGEEVFVLDEESGEYQRYVYVSNNDAEQDTSVNLINSSADELVEPSVEINEGSGLEDQGVDENAETQFNIIQSNSGAEDTFIVVPPKGEKQKQVILSQNAIGGLEPGTVIQCNKCWETYLADDFEDHYKEAHETSDEGDVVIAQDPGFKECAICGLPSRSKKEYLIHFKTSHAGFKLGCPKCPQTYHSPELLHVHYKHFHQRDTPIIPSTSTVGVGGPKRAHVMLRCEYCDDIVEDLPQHLINVHELDEPTALAVTQDRPLQVILDSASQQPQILASNSNLSILTDNRVSVTPSASRNTVKKYQHHTVALHCNICGKDFSTQRDFTNHRRRKDFCKPILPPMPPREEPKTIRRIGIIRKVMKK